MLAALKRLALVLMMMALPAHGLATIIIAFCQFDAPASSSAAHQHGYGGAHDHDRDASAPDHVHPPAAGDLGSDHCGASGSFAIPMMFTGLAPAVDAERSVFVAAYCSGFIPEQPQRPPLA